jgi:hypothetical protein
MKKKLFVLFLLIFTVLPMFGQLVDLKIQVQFLPNILAFDRSQARFGNPVSVGVSSDEALKAFGEIQDQANVNGKKIIFTKMDSHDDIAKYKAVYIDDNWGKDMGKIIETAKANQILVICRKEDWLENGGAVSFRKVLNKPQVVVHQENSKALGSSFIANFLKAVIVI